MPKGQAGNRRDTLTITCIRRRGGKIWFGQDRPITGEETEEQPLKEQQAIRGRSRHTAQPAAKQVLPTNTSIWSSGGDQAVDQSPIDQDQIQIKI